MASGSLSGLALPVKLSSCISRIKAVTRRRDRAMFLAVSTHQEGRDVNDLSTRSNVALANQDAGVVNGLLMCVSIRNQAWFPPSQKAQPAHALRHCATLRDLVLLPIETFCGRRRVAAGLTVPRNLSLGLELGVITQHHSLPV